MREKEIEGFQLSPQQERLWRLSGDRFDPAYCTSFTLRIDGALQPDALRDALDDVVRRHEILRTTYRRLPGNALPVQVINGEGRFAWESRDLGGLAATERTAALEAALGELRAGPLDVESGPVLRACLVALAPSSHHLLVRLPALNGDAATAAALVTELSRAYAGRTGSLAPGDAAEPIQYADLAAWQHEMIDGEEGESARAFWRRQLESPVLPSWPAAPRAGAGEEFRPASHTVVVPAGQREKLQDLATSRGTTLEAVLLAGWSALVHRQTGQAEFVLGATRDGRGFDELRHALGSFSKLLPLQCRIDSEEPFTKLLARTSERLGEASEGQEYFAWPQDGDAPGGAFLPVAFEHREGLAQGVAGNVRFRLGDPEGEVSVAHGASVAVMSYVDRFSILLSAADDGERLALTLHHDANRLGSDEAGLVGERLTTLLASATTDPEASVSSLEVLGPEERRLLDFEFSGRSAAERLAAEAKVPALVHETIARHAAKDGSRAAVVWKDRRLDYAELDERAARLARRLRQLGVGPDTLVGVCCGRSPEMIVGILSILKAGGAYLPLDPSYPPERLEFMLADSAAPVLLTEKRLAEKITAHSARVALLDDDGDEPEGTPSDDEAPAVSGENLAYVIYTSGSTGTPKGVAVTHANLAVSTGARHDHYDDPVGGYLLPSSFSFDSSVAGIFWTLTGGGTLVIPEDGDERDPNSLAELIVRHHATHVLGLPSLVELLLPHAGRLGSLETVIVAGEECSAELIDRFREALPGARLFNEYGPTEATVWCTVHDLLSEPPSQPVPIGRPIAGARVYVLDKNGSPVPIGVTGELHVGGPGVARGYLGSDELSDEKFVPDRFADDPEARLYRTGDLARFRPDGVIEFLGRVDEQVKIRGYRIELGEIEGALRAHPGVDQVVVVAREDVPGAKRLVGYVVPAGTTAPSSDELRAHVGERLPSYMVPLAFVTLDAFPLTPNGKVDKNELPSPEDAAGAPGTEQAAPASALERLLADTWCEMLKRDGIGVDDDFFELGGNSIQAAVLMNKLHTSLGEHLHVATLFRFPTISRLAAHLKVEHAEAVARAVGGGEAAPAQAEPDRAGGAEAEQEAASVNEMSDEEVSSMLEKMLDEQEGDE